jgi:hypothetical protein
MCKVLVQCYKTAHYIRKQRKKEQNVNFITSTHNQSCGELFMKNYSRNNS